MFKRFFPVLSVMMSAVMLTAAENFINVRDHGAAGDGVSDDAPAIQKAIDAAAQTGGTVFFPIGKYRICKTLTVPGGKPAPKVQQNWITLRGAGGTGSQLLGDQVDYILRAAPASEKYRYSSGTRIYELTFTSFSRQKRCSGIDASGMLRAYIENCNFLFLERGIHTFHPTRKDSMWILRIANNVFNLNRSWAIDIQRAFDIVIVNNVIEAGRGGIKVGTPGDTADAACNTLRIENNVIEGLSEMKDHYAILGASWVGARIAGNYFEANGGGDIAIIPKDGDGWTRGLTITGNTFAPAKKLRENPEYGPILLQRVMDVQITNNFTTCERLIHGKSNRVMRSINVQGNSLSNPASVSFDGLSPAERAAYEKKVNTHKLSRNRLVLDGRMKVGLDTDCGIRIGGNTVSYADAMPQGKDMKAMPGDVVFSRKPEVKDGRVIIGWYCLDGGQSPRWSPISISASERK